MTAVPVPSSPSAVLRQAATLMRERAEKATPSDGVPGGWMSGEIENGGAFIFGGPCENGYRTGTVFRFTEYADCENCDRPTSADAEHIASWHPVVALEAAAILEWTAATREHIPVGLLDCLDRFARAYLGTTEGTET